MTVRQIGDIEPASANEEVAFTFSTTDWGGTPTGVAVRAVDVSLGVHDGTTVTGTILSGSASVSGDNITTPFVVDVTPGNYYRVYVQFTAGGQTYEPFIVVRGEW